MDLLTEEKKGNKESFNKLVESYRHIYYKLAKCKWQRENWSGGAGDLGAGLIGAQAYVGKKAPE